MRTAFIVGTGQIGVACAQLLTARGWQVRTLGRSVAPPMLDAATHWIVDRHDHGRFTQAIGSGGDLLVDTIAFH